MTGIEKGGDASVVYLGFLLVWSLRRTGRPDAPSWWPFGAAGAAGFVSGVVRPVTTPLLALVQAAGAALLLGTVHWLAVRNVPRLRSWFDH
jgi:hypothetical protein